MASLKDLIVSGKARILGYVYGNKFITDGGTASQFVKGDGSLDTGNYVLSSALSSQAYINSLNGTHGTNNVVTNIYKNPTTNKLEISYGTFPTYTYAVQNYVSYGYAGSNYTSYGFLENQKYISTVTKSGSGNAVTAVTKSGDHGLSVTYSSFPTYTYALQNYVSYAYFNQIIEEDEYIVAQSLSIFSDYFNNSASYDGLTNFTRTNVTNSSTNATYLKITTTKNEKGTYLPIATGSTYGLIKLKGSSNSLTTSNLSLTNTTQIYPIAKTSDGFAYVGVSWTYIKGFSAVGSTATSDGSITLSYYYSNSHSGASSGTVTLPTPHYAETAPWSGITGKPSSFTPSSHNHDDDYVKKIGDTMTGALNINLSRSTSIYPLKMLTSTAMSANDISSILLGSANSTGNAASISFKYAGSNNNSNLLSLGFVGATNLINVLRNGNVGIGTASPDTTLRVEGAIKSKSIYPIDSHSYSLGLSTRSWRNAFISGFGGNIAPSNLVFYHMYNSQSPSMSYWESSDSSTGLRGLGKLYTDYRFGNKIAGLPLSAITVKVSNENNNDNEDTWEDITTNENTTINYNTILRILRNFYTDLGLIPGKTTGTAVDSGTNKTPLPGSTDYDRISIILDFTVENRTGYVDVINMYIKNYSRTCKFSIEYMTTASYNSSQTWTVLYEKQFLKIDAGVSANQTIYLTQGLYMNGKNTTDTADTSNHYIRISKLKFKYISTDRIHTTDTVSSLDNEGLTITSTDLTKRQNELRYAPLIGNFALFGGGSISINAASTSGNNKNPCTTGLSRILEQRDVPYLISIYDGIRYGNSTTPSKTDIYMGKITFPTNIYISDDYTYAFENVDKNVTVTIGNSASISSYNAHCSGKIRLYSQASNYVDILSQSTGSNTTFYLPNAGSSTYAVHRTTNNTAIGSSTKSIYIAANGKIEEGSEFAVSGHNHDTIYAKLDGSNIAANTLWSNLSIGGNAATATSAASATQLASSVTIWGQSFNGANNVSGHMTGVGSITASGNITTEITTTSALKESVKNSNGEIGIYVSTNKGLYDFTKTKWIISTGGSATYTFLGLDNVGIGTTSAPTRKLEVNGAIHANTYITSTTYIKSGTAVEATTYVRAIGNDIYAGSASGSQCHMQFNNTTKTLHFIFD